VSSAGTATEDDYDALPYPSLPFAYTQPARLAALAVLHGLDAPAADSASVLELGCASGGNIVPLAARFPGARFLGIDLTARHIREGCERIGVLGLGNIALRQGDISDADLGRETFDYVICQGVFSWAPRAVQETIFRICSQRLAPGGMAVVSYNVLPGWHLRRVIREICLHHAGEGPARERVGRARQALGEIAAAASETEPYGLMLRNEARRAAQMPAAYILGEFLAAENTPLHVRDFVDRAAVHGLGFLCEADLGGALTGADRLAEEQRQDFIAGRSFRRSVLVRSEHLATATFPANSERLSVLHIAGRPKLTETGDVTLAQALSRLAGAFPGTVAVSDLMARADDPSRLCAALLSLVRGGQASVSTLPLAGGRADAERPRIWPVARIEAAAKQPWLTSLAHEAVPLHSLPRAIIARLDGRHDREDLKRIIEGNGGQTVEGALKQLADLALLAPD
jgi:SAM-dependent methyltransferase